MLSLPSDMSLRSGGLYSPDLQIRHNLYIPRQAKIVALYKAETTGYQDFAKTWGTRLKLCRIQPNSNQICFDTVFSVTIHKTSLHFSEMWLQVPVYKMWCLSIWFFIIYQYTCPCQHKQFHQRNWWSFRDKLLRIWLQCIFGFFLK